ncbi:hypothetical protein [Actinoplanes sp. NPDC049599]|uniref:hypothetical protein n=1 Tax=Actinoplanes sp. NPDC049599 TaxID=3363903 RepID=UPI0037A72696
MTILHYVAADAADSSPSITDWLTLVVAVLALAGSVWAIIYNRSSASSARSAVAEAKKAAAAAERVSQSEIDRDHEMFRPPQIGSEAFSLEVNPRTKEENLVLKFTPARTYRITGQSIEGDSHSPLSCPLFNPAGVPVRIVVDVLRPHRERSAVKELRLSFWPPAQVDKRDLWTCRCGQPLESHESAHWEVTVPVVTPPRTPAEHVYSA